MIRDVIEGMIVGIVLTIASYLVGQNFGWWDLKTAYDASPLWLGVEVAGVVLNYACVYLVARQGMANWPLGIIAVLFLGALSWHLNLLASMTLSLGYFLPIQFIGWWNWKYGGENKSELKISGMSMLDYIFMAVVGVVSWYVVVQVYTYFDAASTHYDVGILVLSVVAQFMCNQKRPESGFVWLAVNVLSIYVYYTSGAFLWAAQYALFLCNAFYGYALWRISQRKDQIPVHFGR